MGRFLTTASRLLLATTLLAAQTGVAADNDVYAGGGADALSIVSAAGGGFENLVADTAPATTVIVDLVDTGNTLKANGLTPLEHIMDISSRLIVNRASQKMKNAAITALVDKIEQAVK